jgi:hypothetical protein
MHDVSPSLTRPELSAHTRRANILSLKVRSAVYYERQPPQVRPRRQTISAARCL